MFNQRSSHTHCQAPQAQTQTQACQRVCLPLPREEFQNFSPSLKRKKIKTRQHSGYTDRKENEVVI